MVGIAVGGLGVVSLRLPFTLWSTSAHVLDIPSVVLAICLVAFFAFIAYLTNPNEASFRGFLTELVFRQHLSRLSEAHNNIESDDLDDESPSRQSTSDDEPHRTRKLSNHRLNATSSSDTTVPIVFHFANKASVSLRTPSYDFRSFLVVTFAVVPPVEMAMIPPIPPSSHTHHHSLSVSPKPIFWNNPLTRGSCFIGAFGRWWLAFEMNMQPRQVKLAAQNDASISSRLRPGPSGDDNNVALDSSLSASSSRHEDLSGKTTAKPQQPGTAIPRRSSGSSRANTKGIIRERNSIQSLPKRDPVLPTNLPPRPTTPPPLPKSASLPLHAKRIPSSPEQHKQLRSVPPSLIPPSCAASPFTSTQPSQQGPPAVPDQSPIISDLLEQLESARGAASDLQSQLVHARATSESTTANLEAEVAQARATKKNEDSARAALKARTKSLDDSRRHADSTKREAEKRLKAAESRRDHSNYLIERLGAAVENMKRDMEEEVVRVEEQRVSDAEKRVTLTAELAVRKEELKDVEAQVQVLAARARVLESAVAEEKAKSEKLKEVRDKQTKEKEEKEDSASASPSLSSSWPPRLSPGHYPENAGLRPAFAGLPVPRPPQHFLQQQQQVQSQVHPPGNLSVAIAPSTHFISTGLREDPLSPISTSLISSSLMKSMDISSLHGQNITESEVPISPIDSPTSSGGGGGGGGVNTVYEEPFTIVDLKGETLSMRPIPSRIRFDDTSFVSPSVTSGNASKLLQRPKSPSPSPATIPSLNNAASTRRRWFGINLKEKGLNPDAKVFTLPNQGSAFTSAIGSPANSLFSNDSMGAVASGGGGGGGLATGFGMIGSGHAHTDNRPSIPTRASEFGPIGPTSTTTATTSSPDFFQHPRSSLSAPSLQDSRYSTGSLSRRDTSSPPTRSTAVSHIPPPPPPVPSFPFDGGFFSTLQNAFAPSPEEREVLFRALGKGPNSANTSREKLSGLLSMGSSDSSAISTSNGPLSSSGSGSSGFMSVSSTGTGSPSSSHRTTSSITNPSPRWNGAIVHMPITAHSHTHIHALPHSTHTHPANTIARSQTHRSAFDPWAGEGKSNS